MKAFRLTSLPKKCGYQQLSLIILIAICCVGLVHFLVIWKYPDKNSTLVKYIPPSVFEHKEHVVRAGHSLDCLRVFTGDREYARRKRHPISADPPEKKLPMDCKSIMMRSGLDMPWPISQEERDFPIAFVRVVFQDYLLLEAELATNYSPYNWYCFVSDSKANPVFRSRLHKLASCLDNVVVVKREFDITSKGHNTSNALMECANELAREERRWHYLITLQNHDIQAKTNAEMVRILKALNGANDIEVGVIYGWSMKARMDFYIKNFNWTFASLKLFKNKSKNKEVDSTGYLMGLRLSKGYMSAALSRAFIDFVVHELDLRITLAQLNQGEFGVDEHLWQSLSTSDALDAPGGFTQRCYEEGNRTPFVTRFALWADEGPGGMNCWSENWRHSNCLFELEDLSNPKLLNLTALYLNKMMPEADYSAIRCWHWRMRERRMAHSEQDLDMKRYEDWPQARYQKLKRKMGHRFRPYKFNCN